MQHLSPQICKQLEEMGLVSEVETFWYRKKTNPRAWFVEDYTLAYSRTHERVPAFTISDILLNADNARKLWSDEKVCPNCGKPDIEYKRYDDFTSGEIEMIGECLGCHHQPQEDFFGVEPSYIWHTTRLKNIVLSGTDIEPELQKAI